MTLKNQTHFKTIVLSDIHLGAEGSKVNELIDYLKFYTCDKLILNGDIIDGWKLKGSGKWKKKHTKFIKLLLKLTEKYDTKIIYLRGNHDDFLDNILPFKMGNITIVRNYILNSCGKRYLVIHGDIFDSITSQLKWLAKLGDIGYSLLIWLNTRYNNYRTRKGLPYYSLSKEIKNKVKQAVNFISDFETKLVEIANKRNCNGIICGHIHSPAIKMMGDIEYMNSGDWIENLSGLFEDYDGNWQIKLYTEFLEEKRFNDSVISIQEEELNLSLSETPLYVPDVKLEFSMNYMETSSINRF